MSLPAPVTLSSDEAPARLRTRTVPAALVYAALGALTILAAGSARAASPNLLSGQRITETRGASNLARLHDGEAPEEGAFWLTDVTARISTPTAYVTWDLGRVESIRCVELQGDNNDFYFVSGSLDGNKFFPIWTAPPVDGAGMRYRTGKVVASARWIRLSAGGGDGMYSVGEVALYATCPDTSPVEPRRVAGEPTANSARSALWLFALSLAGFILLHNRHNVRLSLLLALLPLGLGVSAAHKLFGLYPLFNNYGHAGEQTFEALLRALVAGLTSLVLYKEAFVRRALTPDPRVRNALLGFFAVVAVGCYYHFGAAQFFNHAEGRRTHVHTFDQRHYVPMGKYFEELKFDGLYAASFAAYVDLAGKTIDELGETRFRDLRSSQIRRASDMKDHIESVRARFSEARWAAFKADMRNFIEIMGHRDYLGGMVDHGGNATPVWILGAHLLLRNAEFSEKNLTLVGFIDPVLVLLLFVFVWRTYGFRIAAYVMILFGATDFYMFGTNLMGSILRQDWLVAIGLGACAIKRGRPMLGGALIAYAGLIRAFPATATLFLATPILWYVIDHCRREKTLPAWRDIVRVQRAAVRAVLGAALCVVVFVVATSAVLGARASWLNWAQKISIHAHDPSVNNVGLRNIMAFKPDNTAKNVMNRRHTDPWDEWQRLFNETLAERRPLHVLLMLAFVLATLLAARNRRLEQAAILGLLIVPWVFYPSNYYLHYIFLLPLGVAIAQPSETDNRRFAWTVLCLCALCVGQFFTLAEGWTDLRFTYQSFLLLAAFIAIVTPMARETIQDLWPPHTNEKSEAPDDEEGDEGEEDEENEDDDEDEVRENEEGNNSP